MAAYNPQVLYLDPPKTGTVYVVAALSAILPDLTLATAHCPPPFEVFRDRRVFATYRHPLSLYVSHWAYAQLEYTGHWRDLLPDPELYSRDDPATFQRWLSAALAVDPGYYSQMLSALCYADTTNVDCWLPTHDLRTQLQKLFESWEADCVLKPNWRQQLPLQRLNASRHRPWQSYYTDATLIDRVRQSEPFVADAFYPHDKDWILENV